ncbi:MAG: suppressor of fused domain protein [Oleispira sp.]|nr:suppressor of fused domain protein [Oleispira sp.]MBL4880949.1 suppressor of fused domain protein [Oleispira sp.]
MTENENLNFDIKRSIILAEYIKCWGMPETRKLMPQSKEAGDSLSHQKMPVELYVFPGEDMDQVTRVATIGLSSCKFHDDKICNNELLMVLPFDVADDELESVSQYIFEISNYIVNTLGRNVKSEDLIAEVESAPSDWPNALLFDDPRGEPNELNYFHIGMQHVTLSWLVPIFASEYELIKSSGIESFDAAVDNAETSLVEVRRDACV